MTGHVNKVYPVGLDLSPCGRFVATGSEDRHGHVFDIRLVYTAIELLRCSGTLLICLGDRMGRSLTRIGPQADVVTGAKFTPNHGLLTSCLDGFLHRYASPALVG